MKNGIISGASIRPKWRALGIAFFATAMIANAYPSITLVQNGVATSSIVVAQSPTRSAQFAAFELQHFVKRITGATLPIVRSDAPPPGTRILVGESGATRTMGLFSTNFISQEYAIRFADATNLILMGRDANDLTAVVYTNDSTWPGWHDDQATCYAVYDFLERFCNVRWFNPTESGTVCSNTLTLVVSGADAQRAPFFKMRTGTIVDWGYPAWDQYDAGAGTLWAYGSSGYSNYVTNAYASAFGQAADEAAFRTARSRSAKLFMHRRRLGGQRFLCNHSMNAYFGRFHTNHPDWFAQGHPLTASSQLCFANTGLIAQVAADAADYYDGKPTPGQWWAFPNTYPVAPMDGESFCRCANCQPWMNRDTLPYYSRSIASDYVFNFVNQVASNFLAIRPGKRLITLAYEAEAAPPTRVALNTNVDVQFCFTANQTPYKSAEYNHELGYLKAWGEEAKTSGRNLSLWMYGWGGIWWGLAGQGKTFQCLPSYYAHKADEQFKLYRDYNYRQGMFYDGWVQEVDAYISLELMDDPSRNVDTLLTGYFAGLYGPAAGAPMQQMYSVLEDMYCNPTNYPWFYPKLYSESLCWGWLGTAERMAALSNLMAQAKAAATVEPWKTNVKLFEIGTWDCMVTGRQHFVATHPAPTVSLKLPTNAVFSAAAPITLSVSARSGSCALFGLSSENLWRRDSNMAQGWHHVLATRDQEKMELFVDGVSQGSCPYVPGGRGAGTTYIGGADNGGRGLRGILDEIRFSSNVRDGLATYQAQTNQAPAKDADTALLLRLDSSLPAGAATSGCPSWVAGKYGTALEFHGADGARFPAAATTGNVGTIETWVQLKGNGTNDYGWLITVFDDIGGWQMIQSFGYGVGYTIESHAVKVEYFDGDTLIGTTTNYPYTLTWTNASVGIHTIKAKATDFVNQSTLSAPMTITVAGVTNNLSSR